MTPTSERRLARILLAGLLLWWGLAIAGTLLAQEHLEVRFLDVGQADAILVSHDGRRILYDAGAPITGERGDDVATRLRVLGVDTLDLVVLSHPHADHIGGMPGVLDEIVVRILVDSGHEHDTEIYRRTYAMLDSLGVAQPTTYIGIPWYSIPGGDILLGDARAWILPAARSGSVNDRSIGLRVCLLDGCVLLAGDAEHEAWARWVEEYPQLLESVAVHKASHHGSRNGDTAEALALLSPELVVVSTGTGDRYGHPHPEALRLYEDVGARVLRTDTHGETIVEIYRDGTTRTWVERWPDPPPRRFWWWAPSSFGPMQ